MNRYKSIILVVSVAGIVSGGPTAVAQTTFQAYRCADGTNFIVGFYPYDSHVYMQIDGREVTLLKRLAFSGRRYSARDVTFRISKAGGTTIRHARRPETACELTTG
jgi:membrane-bound inhibitor of C-type lysozyme